MSFKMEEYCDIVIMSCDKNKDLWPMMISSIEKYWSECALDIYIVTETITEIELADHSEIRALATDGKTWGERFLKALDKIEKPYILFLLDDYFLNDYANDTVICKITEMMCEKKVNGVIYLNSPVIDINYKSYYGLKKLKNGETYCISALVAIWDVAALKRVTHKLHSPWTWEVFGSVGTFGREIDILAVGWENVYPHHVGGAIHRGKWAEKAIPELKKNFGDDFDFSLRGTIKFEDINTPLTLGQKIDFLLKGFIVLKLKMFIFLKRRYFPGQILNIKGTNKDKQSKKILITGSTGFIGENLRRMLLEKGSYQLFETNSQTTIEELKKVLPEVDLVVHLAAVHRPNCDGQFEEINFGLTKIIVDHLVEHNRDCPVIYTSSIQADSGTLYGNSKLKAEEYVAKLRHHYILRLTNLFGPFGRADQHSVVATFMNNIVRNKPITVASDKKITLLSVDVVIREIASIIENISDTPPGLYFMEYGRQISIEKLAKLIMDFNDNCAAKGSKDFDTAFERELYNTFMWYKKTIEDEDSI